MTHNFVTKKYKEVNGILINSDPKRFCVLSVPPDFNNIDEFLDYIEELCLNLNDIHATLLSKDNLNLIVNYYIDGYLLFPFNTLYAQHNTLLAKMPKKLVKIHMNIVTKLNGRHRRNNTEVEKKISGLVFRILVSTKNVKNVNSLTTEILDALLSDVIINKSFIKRYNSSKRLAIRALIKRLGIYFNNNQYMTVLSLTRKGLFIDIRKNMGQNEIGSQWLQFEINLHNDKALKHSRNHMYHLNLLFLTLNNENLFDFEKVFSIKNVSFLSSKIHNNIIKYRPSDKNKLNAARAIREFLEYVANNTFGIYDDVEKEYSLPPGYSIPLNNSLISTLENNIGEVSRPSQSTNLGLPIKWFNEIKQILTEDNYAWPKKAFPKSFINWINPETGQEEKVWCPVVTYIILIKLELPLRTIQIRSLDSGEGDVLKYDMKSEAWIPNNSQHAGHWIKTGASNTSRGVLRKIVDNDTHKTYTGFYINTNKIMDRNNLHDEHSGQVIPWENKGAIKIFSQMRDWNEKYNPLSGPTKFSDIKKNIFGNPSSKISARLPDRFYLFRTPVGIDSQYYHSPPSNDQVNIFWISLIYELEKRLKKKTPDFNIELISSRSEGGHPRATHYTLHGLRTAGLTALAKAGVPPYVLSKIVAGHQNYVMTFYYFVPGPSYITEELDKAKLRILENETLDFKQFLSDNSFEEARKIATFNLDVFTNSWDTEKIKTSAWSEVADIGFCPRSQMSCETGGSEALTKRRKQGKMYNVYGPVDKTPNGKNDCARCRFFITGPPFLYALTAKFNEASAEATRVSKIYNETIKDINELEEKHAILNINNNQIKREEIIKLENLASEEFANAKRLDSILNHMHALANHAQKCRALMKEWMKTRNKNEQLPITLFSSEIPKIDYTETSRLEVVHEIIQSSKFFKSIETENFEHERDEFINKMLLRNHKLPILLMLSKEESRIAAEALVNFLIEKIGRTQMNSLIDGHESLESLGLENHLDEKLTKLFDKPINLSIESQKMIPELAN